MNARFTSRAQFALEAVVVLCCFLLAGMVNDNSTSTDVAGPAPGGAWAGANPAQFMVFPPPHRADAAHAAGSGRSVVNHNDGNRPR